MLLWFTLYFVIDLKFVNSVKMTLEQKKAIAVLFQGDSSTKQNKYVELLEKEGVSARSVPVLSFNFINREYLQTCLKNPDFYSGIIFTSTRSVNAVSSLISLNDVCINKWKQKTNFSVGTATANSALSELKLQTHGADSGNSENLCKLIIEMHRHLDKPLLFPCSNIRKDTIPTVLSKSGISVEEVFCYETVPNNNFECIWQNIISETLPNILVFFSPSGVQSCINVIKNAYVGHQLPIFIAIGPSTEKALSEADIYCKVAEKPTPESLMYIIKELEI